MGVLQQLLCAPRGCAKKISVPKTQVERFSDMLYSLKSGIRRRPELPWFLRFLQGIRRGSHRSSRGLRIRLFTPACSRSKSFLC